MVPALALPTPNVPAVIFVKVAAGTKNPTAPPLRLIWVAATLGTRLTCPVPAFIAPVAFRFTDPAVTFIVVLVLDTVIVLLTLTMPVPFALRFTPAAPDKFCATVMLPLAAVVVRTVSPEEFIAVFVVMALLFETTSPPNVDPPDDRVKVEAVVLVIPTAPVLFRVKLGVAVLIIASPIAPDTELSDMDVVPDNVPAACDIVPELLADTTMFVPLPALLLNTIEPLLAVVVKVKAPVAVNVVRAVILLLFETLRLANEPAVDKLRAPLFTTVAAPVVPKVKAGVTVLAVMAPPVEDSDTDVVPVMEPVVSVIAPVEPAVIVTVAPLITLVPSTTLVAVEVLNDKTPLDVREPDVVKVLLSATVKLLKVPAAESVAAPWLLTLALPVVLRLSAGVAVVTVPPPMLPDPEEMLTTPVPVTTPAA